MCKKHPREVAPCMLCKQWRDTYRLKNKERLSEYGKQWKKKNMASVYASNIKWRESVGYVPPKKSLSYMLWYNRLRRANLKYALPRWANIDAINKFYEDRPEGYHVDHIIPLKGIDPVTKLHVVCGLHVENNLGYLPAGSNLSKGAWFSL